MNRLVLIGNGFDLAHYLDTSYKDFIEYLWRGIYKQIEEKAVEGYRSSPIDPDYEFEDKDKLLKFDYASISARDLIGINYRGKHFKINLISNYVHPKDFSKSIKVFIKEINEMSPKYLNKFFETISNNYFDKNWSDIEADYYVELKKCIDGSDITSNKENVKKLNEDFLQIKELLRDYLSNLDNPTSIPEIEKHICSNIKIKHIKLDRLNDICSYIKAKIKSLGQDSGREFAYSLSAKEIEGLRVNLSPNYLQQRSSMFDGDSTTILAPEAIMFLNLNYTNTISQYQSKQSLNRFTGKQTHVETIQIHGTLESSEEMIFGYGDEEDQKYQELEMSEIPGLLDNVKSVNYLQLPNYRNLERFIESGPYQIFIMGMSCGLSDRTLLRKLFQHENCISVVPFYYECMSEEGGKKVRKDNFNELSQNISRCFSNKDLLRSLVVDKTNCKPLVSISEKQ